MTAPAVGPDAPPLLAVSDLRVTLRTARGPADAVRGVDFELGRGEALGLIGESGSGKSVTALALTGLLPEHAVVRGSVRFAGRELVGLPDASLRRLRGDRIGMVFQEPMTSLNPLHTIGRQVAEPLRLHRGLDAAAARREAIALLDRVGIAEAARRVDAYPHQLSGGQRQRVTIAMALACSPDLLIADEPTTALDVTIQRQILDLIGDLVEERGMALLLISHDLGVIAENVDRMLVMYGGTVVERGPAAEVFRLRAHPYTQGLFAARPRLGGPRGARLETIPGTVPDLADLPPGCAFAERCARAIDPCRVAPPAEVEVGAGHRARCLRIGS
jgi:peptide/nickel transport system ATP-binding protein